MKKVIIEFKGDRYTQPYINYFSVTKPIKGKPISLFCGYTCREEFIERLRYGLLIQMKYKLNEGESFSNFKEYNSLAKHCLRWAYVGVTKADTTNHADFIKIMKDSLAIINVFEHKNAWPLSKMYETDRDDSVIFKGSVKWIKSPFALSLYTLLMRTGEFEELTNAIIPEKYKSNNAKHKALMMALNKFKTELEQTLPNVPWKNKSVKSRSILRFVETFHIWDLFMSNYDELFRKRTFKSNYGYISVKKYCKVHDDGKPNLGAAFSDGITKLAEYCSSDITIQERFIEMIERQKNE